MDLTQEIVQELIHYNPDTGVCTWKHRDRKWFKNDSSYKKWNARFAGKRCGSTWNAGHNNKNTYMSLTLLGIGYLLHRLIWLYVYGEWPECIDHIDGNGLNNKISNIRNVSSQENSKNRSINENNTSGVTGVTWSKRSCKWHARMMVDGVYKHLGYFDIFEDAVEARKVAEIEQGYHQNHGRGRT